MKKLAVLAVSVIVSAIASLSMSAQTVYYSPVNKTMEVGLGFDAKSHQAILSVIEESKDAADFSFDIMNGEGEIVMSREMEAKNVNVMPKDGDENYYQCNYTLSMPELFEILASSASNETAVINGVQVISKSLASAIQNVTPEHMQPVHPRFPLNRPMAFRR